MKHHKSMKTYVPTMQCNSKTLAKKRLLKHLSESPNWGTFQSAYRPLHSTETAMTRVVNDLLMNVDCGKPSVLLSLDISAAFDTLDHGALLQRTSELFGLYGQVSEWLRTYLSCRTKTYLSCRTRQVCQVCLGVTGWFSLCHCRFSHRCPAGLGPRATAVLHLHCTVRPSDLYV